MEDYELEAYRELEKDRKAEKPRVTQPSKSYKLGEVIANGIKYFGLELTEKSNRTAMCVCPHCKGLWRVSVWNVSSGKVLSCGCEAGKKATK